MAYDRILIVAATAAEINGIAGKEAEQSSPGKVFRTLHPKHGIDVLITGPGMVATSYFLGHVFAEQKYDLAINAGIAGSFSRELALGSVVNVVSDCFPELGVESGERFIPLHIMEMSKPYMPAFIDENGLIGNRTVALLPTTGSLATARGITVNTISGEEKEIEKIRNRTQADIETMEGAAFFYACHMAGVPCLQIRAISNYIEPRNLRNWDIATAIRKLNECLNNILNET